MDPNSVFVIKERYQNHLKKEKDLNKINDAEQLLNDLTETKDYVTSFDDQSYILNYETQEEFIESEQVMASDWM